MTVLLHRVLALVLAGLAVSAVIVGGSVARTVEVQRATTAVAEIPQRATETPDLGVRSLPLVMPSGVLATLAKDRPLTPDIMQSALAAAIRRVGISDEDWYLLRSAAGMDSEKFGTGGIGASYPYRYDLTTQYLSILVPDDAFRSRPRPAWLDLASLLTVEAAHFGQDPSQGSSAIAFVILDRLRQGRQTCDVQLQLAHTVSLGQRPIWDATVGEFRKAQELCGTDPTPLVALGQWQLSVQRTALGGAQRAPSGPQMLNATEATFTELDRLFPDLPLGPSGLAETALQEAEYRDAHQTQPFEAREYYRRALRQSEVAMSRSAAPQLQLARGRAELGLSHPDRALDAADQWLAQEPVSPQALVLRSKALLALGRYPELAENAGRYATARIPSGLQLVRRRDASSESSWRVGTLIGQQDAYPTQLLDATYEPMGGGDLVDFGFLPRERGSSASLRSAMWRSGELQLYASLLGNDRQGFERAASSISGIGKFAPGHDENLKPVVDSSSSDDYMLQPLRALANDEWGTPVAEPATRIVFEQRQDLWRSIADWTRAKRVTDQWTQAMPSDGFAWDRAGEVAFLAGDYRTAATAFEQAGTLLGGSQDFENPTNENVQVDRARLAQVKLGAALQMQGRPSEAFQRYGRAIDPAQSEDVVNFYATSQQGLLSLREQSFSQAARLLQESVRFGEALDRDTLESQDDELEPRYLKGAQENNAALALVLADRPKESVKLAEGAYSRDSSNPIFIETLAYSRQAAGDNDGAKRIYDESVAKDGSNYVARNNLGVVLGRQGDHAGARAQFEAALGSKPDYATAWLNLGVVAANRPLDFLQSQASLARAATLDRELRGAAPTYRLDQTVYQTGLDVSAALPPDWQFADQAKKVDPTLAVAPLAVLGLRVLWTLGLDQVGGRFAEWLAVAGRGRGWRGFLRARFPLVIGVPIVALILGGAALKEHRLPLEIAAVTAFSVIMVIATVVMRSASAQRRIFAWAPSAVAGVALLIPGVGFVPMPCSAGGRGSRWRYWAPTLMLMAVAAVLIVATALSPIPLIRLCTIATVTMLGSALLPVPPHDGAFLPGGKVLALGATAIMAVAGLALAMGWI